MNALDFCLRKLRYLPMDLSLRGLVSWKPLEQPAPGYTVVIACMHNLVEIAIANVTLIARMNLPKMKELIVVFDVTEENFQYKKEILEAAGNLPIRILFYTPKQEAVGKRFSWGWVYSWTSWTKAIALVETKYVLLHDLDAMPIDPDMFENLYEEAARHQSFCQGVSWYDNINNIFERDGFVRTFEMVLDAQQMRQHFSPFDGFNKVMWFKDRFVVMDTFLYMQSKLGNCRVEVVPDASYVHPSQLISQYTDWQQGRRNRHEENPYFNLPLLPVYLYLGGRPEPLRKIVNYLSQNPSPSIPFMEDTIDFTGISSIHWQWLTQESMRLGAAYTGGGAPDDIERYCHLLNSTYNSETQTLAFKSETQPLTA